MRPELPFLAAGGIAIAGGMARDRTWPKDGTRAALATMILVIVASATADSPLAPVVRAMGLLAVLGAVLVTVPVISKAQVKK
ncbi:MAG TPA: hypothetical protein VJ553_00615 [Candidatus Paceibacterota bacterium]|nr:hypothetical protein [Candidatus Paceibacterota bacterium]